MEEHVTEKSPTPGASKCIVETLETPYKEDNTVDNEDDKVDEIVYALSSFSGLGADQLSFDKGSQIKILQKPNEHWWWAEIKGYHGYVPVNHLSSTSLKQIYWEDEEYFNQYGQLKIHQQMLDDEPRTFAYQAAIQKNSAALHDKVILDAGCGTGILSLMCAKYGHPAKVIAVDMSGVSCHLDQVAKQNGLHEIIEVHSEYIEDLVITEKVDLIISEWMGTSLLFEMMLESVIIARDKFLKDTGIMWPSSACLFLCPVSVPDIYHQRVNYWQGQYGFDLSPLRALAIEDLNRPIIDETIASDHCLGPEHKLLDIDMATITCDDLEQINCDIDFTIDTEGLMHGVASWFSVNFCNLLEMKESAQSLAGIEDISVGDVTVGKITQDEICLNTGPDHKPTHWKQALFLFDEPVHVDKGCRVKGQWVMKRNLEWRRHLSVELSLMADNLSGAANQVNINKTFKIWR